jgi:hypothetical protein
VIADEVNGLKNLVSVNQKEIISAAVLRRSWSLK